MVTFTVNGKTVTAAGTGKLMPFLREKLGLTSVKNGCSEGVCGTCTVLVDGRAVKSCVMPLSRLEGKAVLTCEGLSRRERAVYTYAFTHCGAVQCGFCTPGMVLSAKALLDREPEPDEGQIRKALRGNLCRCTGYQKIVEAVQLAGQLLREGTPVPEEVFTGRVGESRPRLDAPAKVLGDAVYADDLRLPGMLWGGAVRSEYPRAVVRSIDVSAARAVPGVKAVVTAADLPGARKVGHISQDQWVLVPVGGITSFAGDAIVLIAADSPAALADARRQVRVRYEPLPPVLTLEESMAPDAPRLQPEGNLLTRQQLIRGDADAALARSAHVVTTRYETPPTDHAFLEPECAVAAPEGDGVAIWSADQGIYQTRQECARAVGLSEDRVHVTALAVGGAFGGKEDMSVQHHAAILALASGQPVKMAFTRAESLLCHPKRHPFRMEVTTGCDENGLLTGFKARFLTDTGAFASLGKPVLQRACTHAAGPYNYHDVDIVGEAWYTNNPPNGAFRGFGVTQSCFAAECNLDRLAELVGISAFEIRYRNAIRPGQDLPNGQPASADTALVETLEAVRPYYEANPKAGIACAMKNSGLGVGIPDVGRVILRVEGGLCRVCSSAACIGQGLGTILCQIVCQTADLPHERVVWEPPDTARAPDAGNSTASRQTLFTGEAARRAALALGAALKGGGLEALEGRSFAGEFSFETDRLDSEKEHPISHAAYGYATHLVELDEDGRVKRVVAAHDVGRPVNPRSIEGQIQGGVVMSLGYALTEDFPLQNGRPTANLGRLGLLRADQTPEVVALIVGKSDAETACGAKGIGEICSIPTAPAVQNAYYNFDGKFRTKLPLEGTPYRK